MDSVENYKYEGKYNLMMLILGGEFTFESDLLNSVRWLCDEGRSGLLLNDILVLLTGCGPNTNEIVKFTNPELLQNGKICIDSPKGKKHLYIDGSYWVIYHKNDHDTQYFKYEAKFVGSKNTNAKYIFIVLSDEMEDVYFIDVKELLY